MPFSDIGSPGFAAALDRHITGNYGADQYPEPPRLGGRLSAEDYLGEKVVVGENAYGLGRWGTITSWEEWTDEDEDGRHGGLDFIVEFADGEHPSTANLAEDVAEDQLQLRKRYAR